MWTNLDPGVVLCKKWKVVRLLRQSETSQAYLADDVDGRQVVLRVLHEGLCRDEVMAARFRREAYVTSELEHPAIVRVVDDDVLPDGRTVLVTELAEGESVEDIRRAFGGRIPLELALGIVTQLLDGLACAHARGIVHRSLRPDLVLVHHGRVKIADFGFARLASSSEDLTEAGLVLGTPQFLAPEQARGHRELVDAQSDLFAVGAIAFLLLSGQHVHPSDSLDAFLHSARRSSARSLRTAAREDAVPDELVHAIDKALAFRKAERWLSAEEMANALRRVLDGRRVEPLWIRGPEAGPWAREGNERPLFVDDDRTVTMSERGRELLHRALALDESGEDTSDRETPATDDLSLVTPRSSTPPLLDGARSSILPPSLRRPSRRACALGVYEAVLEPRSAIPEAVSERNVKQAVPTEAPVRSPGVPKGRASPGLAVGAFLLFVLSIVVFGWTLHRRVPHGVRITSATASRP